MLTVQTPHLSAAPPPPADSHRLSSNLISPAGLESDLMESTRSTAAFIM